MHILRNGRARQRPSFSTILVTCLVVSALFYIIYFRFRQLYYDHEALGDASQTRYINMKYQLANALVSNAKKDFEINHLRTDCRLQREGVREFFNDYYEMKEQLHFSERQAEKFEIESKELNIQLQEAREELAACKKTPD